MIIKRRIEVHPNLEESLKRLKDKIQGKFSRQGVNVILPQHETSRIAAQILNKRLDKTRIVIQRPTRKSKSYGLRVA